jgi:hypothetical protein
VLPRTPLRPALKYARTPTAVSAVMRNSATSVPCNVGRLSAWSPPVPVLGSAPAAGMSTKVEPGGAGHSATVMRPVVCTVQPAPVSGVKVKGVVPTTEVTVSTPAASAIVTSPLRRLVMLTPKNVEVVPLATPAPWTAGCGGCADAVLPAVMAMSAAAANATARKQLIEPYIVASPAKGSRYSRILEITAMPGGLS